MAGGQGGFTFVDYTKEKASLTFHTGVVTAGTLPGLLTQFGALRTAILGIVRSNAISERLMVFNTKLGNTPPTDPEAQVEEKWLVTYEDDLEFFDAPTNAIPNEGFGKVFQMELPGADLSLADVLKPNSDEADLAHTAIAAFITAFEDIARSPHGGTVNVLAVTYVGRNL